MIRNLKYPFRNSKDTTAHTPDTTNENNTPEDKDEYNISFTLVKDKELTRPKRCIIYSKDVDISVDRLFDKHSRTCEIKLARKKKPRLKTSTCPECDFNATMQGLVNNVHKRTRHPNKLSRNPTTTHSQSPEKTSEFFSQQVTTNNNKLLIDRPE